ncbi:hypothetical protein [Mycobacterium leprae]|nr:hypothetical protein [Mycobacterium leprae]
MVSLTKTLDHVSVHIIPCLQCRFHDADPLFERGGITYWDSWIES